MTKLVLVYPQTDYDLSQNHIVRPDMEMWSWDYRVRPVATNVGDAPAVNRTGEFDNNSNFIRSPFTREWQFFWADLCAMRVFGTLLKELPDSDANDIKKLVTDLGRQDRFLTNRKGLDNCNNYLFNDTQDRGEEPQIDPLICATSIVRVLSVQFSSKMNMNMARLWTFKAWETPPKVTMDLLLHDQRVLRATNIFADGHTANFDQIYNRWPELKEHWVPYPYISSQTCWFPYQDLRKA